jgi:hypothetical protein
MANIGSLFNALYGGSIGAKQGLVENTRAKMALEQAQLENQNRNRAQELARIGAISDVLNTGVRGFVDAQDKAAARELQAKELALNVRRTDAQIKADEERIRASQAETKRLTEKSQQEGSQWARDQAQQDATNAAAGMLLDLQKPVAPIVTEGAKPSLPDTLAPLMAPMPSARTSAMQRGIAPEPDVRTNTQMISVPDPAPKRTEADLVVERAQKYYDNLPDVGGKKPISKEVVQGVFAAALADKKLKDQVAKGQISQAALSEYNLSNTKVEGALPYAVASLSVDDKGSVKDANDLIALSLQLQKNLGISEEVMPQKVIQGLIQKYLVDTSVKRQKEDIDKQKAAADVAHTKQSTSYINRQAMQLPPSEEAAQKARDDKAKEKADKDARSKQKANFDQNHKRIEEINKAYGYDALGRFSGDTLKANLADNPEIEKEYNRLIAEQAAKGLPFGIGVLQ